MKFKKIQTKMLATILPVISIAFLALIIIAGYAVNNLSTQQIDETMQATRQENINQVNATLDGVSTMADTIAASVANSYTTLSLEDYETMLGEIIQQNDIVLGSGIWFEPYVYDEEQEYVGPYVYKDGDSVVTTYDYSNADYDYFNQEYYTNAKNSTGAVITDPYYDETSGDIMSSCSTPIIVDGNYIGCITVDMELTSISELIDAVKVGEAGNAFLISSDGTYIAGVTQAELMSAASILNGSGELASVGQKMLAENEGNTVYTNGSGVQYDLYYGSIAGTGWKLGVQIPYEEIMGPAQRVVNWLVLVGIIALILSGAVILLQVRSIAKSIQLVKTFAGSLAEGNFTVDPLSVSSKDEIGNMSSSLNEMFDSNRNIIGNISEHSFEIAESSQKLSVSASRLLDEFNGISDSMNRINEAMLSTSAATQEVNASAEEVNASVNLLASETEESLQLSSDIQKRATEVEIQAKESSESATKLVEKFKDELAISVENAKVVKEIDELATVIASIADQISLLSLNASIEAARAGEHGRGFSVVASEIGNLANETSNAVGNIQLTVGQVQVAFEQLNSSAQEMLKFVSETVTPDYGRFVETASQYGEDAKFFAEVSNKVSDMSNNIQMIMSEVSDAIQSIAESSADTTNISSEIVESVTDASETVSEVSDMSSQQNEIAENLDNVVRKFQL